MADTHNYEWLSLAKRQWPNFVVVGSGRWAIPSFNKVLLFETRGEAERQILDHRQVTVIDLLPLDFSKMPDRYYDREEARRERREKQ
jgi:hypothetical protein